MGESLLRSIFFGRGRMNDQQSSFEEYYNSALLDTATEAVRLGIGYCIITTELTMTQVDQQEPAEVVEKVNHYLQMLVDEWRGNSAEFHLDPKDLDNA